MANYSGISRAGQYMAGPTSLRVYVSNAPDGLTQLNHQGIIFDLAVSELYRYDHTAIQIDASHVPFSRESWTVHPPVTAPIDAPFHTETRLTTETGGRGFANTNANYTGHIYRDTMPRPLFDQRVLRQQQEALAEADRIRAERLRTVAPNANIRQNTAIQNVVPPTPDVDYEEVAVPTARETGSGIDFSVRVSGQDLYYSASRWQAENLHMRDMERSMTDQMRSYQDQFNLEQIRIDAMAQIERDRQRSRHILEMMTPPPPNVYTWTLGDGIQEQIQARLFTRDEAYITGVDPYRDTQSAPVDGHEVHTLSETGVQMNNPGYFHESLHVSTLDFKTFWKSITKKEEPEVKETDPKFAARFEEEDPF